MTTETIIMTNRLGEIEWDEETKKHYDNLAEISIAIWKFQKELVSKYPNDIAFRTIRTDSTTKSLEFYVLDGKGNRK